MHAGSGCSSGGAFSRRILQLLCRGLWGSGDFPEQLSSSDTIAHSTSLLIQRSQALISLSSEGSLQGGYPVVGTRQLGIPLLQGGLNKIPPVDPLYHNSP